ncbi:MAG: cytochrome o ubiquinol oxidase subunit I, partial [Bartonella sp.]|nr:cytochrome o ubiquinol oxidase subunit I [Bartonella sp.]
PSNTSAGIVAGFFSLIVGFALVWHIWWLVIFGLVGFVTTIIYHSLMGDHHGYYISAEEVQKTEDIFTAVLEKQGVKV